MHIGIVNWSLLETKGGLERFGCNLAAAMLDKGHAVTLFCEAGKTPGAKPTYPVPSTASLTPLALGYSTRDLAPARTLLRASGIDVLAACFSWESLLWFPALLTGTGIPLLISEHNHPELINKKWNAYERNACLGAADRIHILLDQFLPLYPEELHDRITVIPNPVTPLGPARSKRTKGARRILLGVGRLSEPVKRFSLLLEAFALLAGDFPDWDLRICGDGDSFEHYARWIKGSGLEGRIALPGRVDNVADEYANADIFCIPSRYEGFGLVTTEAQQFALPAVGFKDCSGTNAIIVHGVNGLLAEERTSACLAGYLGSLMRDEALRADLGQRGRELLRRYDPQKVYGAWEEMLLQAAARKGRTALRALEQNGGGPGDPLREILNRPHPFDRSRYITLHRKCKAAGRTSPFTEAQIARFRNKSRRFGFSGPKKYLHRLASWVGRIFS